MNLQIGLLEVGIALTVLLGACGVTWFAADAHYSKQLATLQGQLDGAAKAQTDAVNAQKQLDSTAAETITNDAKSQIGTMADELADLSLRLAHPARTVRLCTSPAGARGPDGQPNGPGAKPSGAANPGTTAAGH